MRQGDRAYLRGLYAVGKPLRLPAAASALFFVCLCAVGLAGAAAGPVATHGPNLWAGDWNTSSGKVGWRLLRPSEIRDAQSADDHKELYDKLKCHDGPQFYEGGYAAVDEGKVIACGTPTEIEGRWLSNVRATNHGSFTLEINSQNPLTFTGTAVPDGGKPFRWTGRWFKAFGGDGARSPFIVDFAVLVKGKPNLTIKGAPNAALTTARLSGQGHLTLTVNRGDLLEATETKGKISLDETYAGGKSVHLELGVQSHSLYSPANNRLALVLDVKRSTDPLCPSDGVRVATLTLLPTASGVRDTAIFFGVPYSQTHKVSLGGLGSITLTTDPCKGGHAHGWENGSGRVQVRTRVSPSTGS